MPDTTGRPGRKPAFARLNGTTTYDMALEAMLNTITDSSTASKRCYCSPHMQLCDQDNLIQKYYSYLRVYYKKYYITY